MIKVWIAFDEKLQMCAMEWCEAKLRIGLGSAHQPPPQDANCQKQNFKTLVLILANGCGSQWQSVAMSALEMNCGLTFISISALSALMILCGETFIPRIAHCLSSSDHIVGNWRHRLGGDKGKSLNTLIAQLKLVLVY